MSFKKFLSESVGIRALNQTTEILENALGENFYQMMYDALVDDVGPENVTKIIDILKPELMRTAEVVLKNMDV